MSNQMNVPAEVLTEEEKDSIISAAKVQYKHSIQSRRVEAVLVSVDAEVNDEINKIGLDSVCSKSGCFLM
jgi:hypothetical protein